MGVGDSFVCPRCGNSDPRYIGTKNGKPYCRKCISFIGTEVKLESTVGKFAPIDLKYSLSDEQRKISRRIIHNYIHGVDTLVYAVTGAGKTEISYGVISYAVEHGKKVGFAVPRRDVVIELYWRLKETFPRNKVVAVYGEHTYDLQGDIIILTTHQLYRYPGYFGLIVMDEIDAFPYKGSDVLEAMFFRSLNGHYVLMSATPSPEILKEFSSPGKEVLELRTRFHKHPLPVPIGKSLPKLFQKLYALMLLRKYGKTRKQCFLFAPTIAETKDLFDFVHLFVKHGNYVNSKRENRDKIISSFKKGHYRYLVTSSVLERGVTVKDLQIIVINADRENIYDAATLIQIAGRAGRKFDAPEGDVYFLYEKETEAIKDAIKEIKYCNTFLQTVLSEHQ